MGPTFMNVMFSIEMGEAFFKEKKEKERGRERNRKKENEIKREGEKESPKKRNDTILIMDDSGDG